MKRNAPKGKSQKGKWLFGIRSRAHDLITVALHKGVWGRVITNIITKGTGRAEY